MLAVITASGHVTLLGQTASTATTDTTDTTALTTATTEEVAQHAPNPVLPAKNEIVWGTFSFLLLLFLMWKFAFPAIANIMKQRTDRIRADLDAATTARTEAEGVLAEYQKQLADARTESSRIIEEARQTADNLRKDLIARAEAEAAEIRQRAAQDVEAAKSRTMSDLRSEVTTLAIDLAEKVVGHNLDRATNEKLVESFIAQVGSSN